MRVFVSTCDKYDHLLPGFAHQFNKYWGADQEVCVLGFRPPPALPANFQFHSMEPVETVPWSTNLHRAFESIPDPYFVFLFDDYWLMHTVDRDAVARMENYVKQGAVKGDLSENTKNFSHTAYDHDMVMATADAHYRTSTQPCIWSRRWMLDLLRPGLNPWQFELQSGAAVKAGRIIGPTWQIFKFANVYYKGGPDPYMLAKLSDADKAELTALGMLRGIL